MSASGSRRSDGARVRARARPLLVARRNGVRIEVFSIGFGPELFGWKDRAGTRWKFSAIPLGGYVKMLGDSDASSGLPVARLGRLDRRRSARCRSTASGWASAPRSSPAGPIANFAVRDRRAGAPVHDLRPAVHAGRGRAGAARTARPQRRHPARRHDRQHRRPRRRALRGRAAGRAAQSRTCRWRSSSSATASRSTLHVTPSRTEDDRPASATTADRPARHRAAAASSTSSAIRSSAVGRRPSARPGT